MRRYRNAFLLTACACLSACKKATEVLPAKPVVPTSSAQMFSQNEALLGTLAAQVQKGFFSDRTQDWQNTNVVVAPFDFKVGELIVPGSTRPLPHDDTSCAPAQQPGERKAGTMFPNYKLTGTLALDFGLGSLLPVNASTKVGNSTVVDLNFSGTTVALLPEADFAKLVATPSCRDAYSGQPLLIVRGYVRTKKRFNIEHDVNAQASVATVEGPSANLSAGSEEASGYEDDEPTELLLVLSQVSAESLVVAPLGSPASGPRSGRPLIARAAVVTKPIATAGQGRIYVQRDAADHSDKAGLVLANVATVSNKLVPTVEAIPSGKMPKLAQVRYFRSADKDVADKVLGQLRKTYPNAISKFVGLPSPPGQMEVWLAKVG